MNADPAKAPIASAPPSPAGVARWRWWVHLILIGGYFLPLTFFHRGQTAPVLTNRPAGLLVVSAVDLLVFGIVFGLALLVSRATRDELYLRWRPGWWVLPLGLGYSIAIRIAAAAVMIPIVIGVLLVIALTGGDIHQFMAAHQPRLDHLFNPAVLSSNRAYYWLILTLVSFINAGVREELWRVGTLAGLRALFPNAFASVRGQIAAVALIAILFGAAHVYLGLIGAVMAGILGLLLGIIIVGHRSVWPAVFAHGFLDATSFAAVPFLLNHLPRQ